MSSLFDNIRTTFANWRARRRTIDALSALNDHQLRDIGIHRDEIISVASEVVNQVEPTRIQTRRASRPAVQPAPVVDVPGSDIDWRQAA